MGGAGEWKRFHSLGGRRPAGRALAIASLLAFAVLPVLLLHHDSDNRRAVSVAHSTAQSNRSYPPRPSPRPSGETGGTQQDGPHGPRSARRLGHRVGEAGLLFFTIGDWGGVTRVSRAVTAEMARYAANHGGCSFILSTGDNFYDDGVASVEDPQWNTTFQALFARPGLHVPFFSSLGNHDHRGNVSAQILYSHAPHNMGWWMPDRCYSETMQVEAGVSSEFFVLNSYDGKRKLDVQLPWLEGKLKSSRATWKFLVNHNPIFSGGSTHGATTGFGRWAQRTKELFRKLLPLIQRHKVHAVFSGDDHTLQILESGNMAFFVSGAGGGRERGMFHNAVAINQTVFVQQHVGGFMAHHLNGTSLLTHVVKWNGKLLHTHLYQRAL
eukprot:GGOE01043970.1.p1 GENE.GGOE01043970.1~~GGOE01043970.1.p1  ORF type:complete len:382 (-),score=74.77 GGOE01043970.1:197-1342(-)